MIRCSLFFSVVSILFLSVSAKESADVFIGPFANWMDVKRDYGAIGNGTTNDAQAFQNAFNALPNNTTSHVLYIPAGTYLINSTLALKSVRNCVVIGEDPATTILKWGGAANGDMIISQGVAFSRYSRLTLEGANSANRGIFFKWNYIDFFPTNNEVSDMIFQNIKIGIQAGTMAEGGQHTVAETPFIRCQFKNCASYGILIDDWNTCDLWARFCLFYNCGTGVGIASAGQISIMQSVFKNNTLDINQGGSKYWCSIRNNYSSGSQRFLIGVQKMTVAGNVIEPTGTSNIINSPSQYSFCLVMDNIVRMPAGAAGPVITVGNSSSSGAKLLSVNNTFTIANYNGSPSSRTAIRSIGDKVVDRNTLTLTEPVLPSTSKRFTGPIIEPTAMNASAIQAAIITAASTYKGQKPVVHLKFGNHSLASKLIIPGGSDVRLVGDVGMIADAGNATELSWTGGSGDTMIVLRSPAKAELKDFYLSGATRAYGIYIDKVDQPGSRVFMDQISTNQFAFSNRRGLYVDGIDNTVVEGWHCYLSGQQGAIISRGGPRSLAGDTTTTARVDIFGGNGGANSTTYPQWDVKDNGRLMVQDLWWETGGTRGLTIKLDNTSSGTLTMNGGKHQYYGGAALGNPTHSINGFKGRCTAINLDMYDAIVSMAGSEPQQNVLFLCTGFSPNGGNTTSSDPGATYTMSATAGTNVMMYNNYWTQLTPTPRDIGTPTDDWLLQMLKQTRTEQPSWDINTLPDGLTDVRIWRVGIDNTIDALTVKGGGSNVPVKQGSIGCKAAGLFQGTTMVALGGRVAIPVDVRMVKLFNAKGVVIYQSVLKNSSDRANAGRIVNSQCAKNIGLVTMQ